MKNAKRKLLVVFSCSLAGILMTTFGVSSLAWFSSTREAGVSASNFVAGSGDVDVSAQVIKYSYDTASVIDATSYDDACELNEYDSILTARNQYTAIYLIVETEALTSGTLSCTIECTTGTPYSSDAGYNSYTYKIAEYISNIIEFKVIASGTTLVGSDLLRFDLVGRSIHLL